MSREVEVVRTFADICVRLRGGSETFGLAISAIWRSEQPRLGLEEFRLSELSLVVVSC